MAVSASARLKKEKLWNTIKGCLYSGSDFPSCCKFRPRFIKKVNVRVADVRQIWPCSAQEFSGLND